MTERGTGRGWRLAAVCLGSILAFGAAEVVAQTAEDIVEANIQAVGGEDAVRKIKGLTASGRMRIGSSFGSLEGLLRIGLRPGKGVYQLWDAAGVSGGSGWDGTVAWESSPAGLRQLEGEDLWRVAQQSYINLFAGLREFGPPDLTIDRVADERVGDADCFALVVSGSGLPTATVYVDKGTSLIVRQSFRMNVPGLGEVAVVTDLLDYQALEGVQMANRVISTVGDGLQEVEITFSDGVVNGEIDEGLFAMPK